MQMFLDLTVFDPISVFRDGKDRTMRQPPWPDPHQKAQHESEVHQGCDRTSLVETGLLQQLPGLLPGVPPESQSPLQEPEDEWQDKAQQDNGFLETLDGLPFKSQRVDSIE